MGIFDLFSSNYKPKDFAGKTPEQIFTEVKLDKFSKSIKNVNDPEYMALDDQAKNAIDLLIDLKNGKLEIYKKCYSGESKPIAHMPAMRPPHSPPRFKPAEHKPEPAMVKPEPVKPEPVKPAEEGENKEEVMTGGRGRKHKKTHKRKHGKRKGKKRGKTARRKY
jgi:hypothetical protein